MIELTRMNNEKFYLNPNMIEAVEITPDRLVTVLSGRKYFVLESIGEISAKFEAYYKKIALPQGKSARHAGYLK